MSDLADRLGVATPVLALLLVAVVVEIGLAIYALLDLWRRDRVAGGHKWLWVVVILLGNPLGSILYLVVGRDVPPVVEEQAASHVDAALTTSERIQSGVDELYGPKSS